MTPSCLYSTELAKYAKTRLVVGRIAGAPKDPRLETEPIKSTRPHQCGPGWVNTRTPRIGQLSVIQLKLKGSQHHKIEPLHPRADGEAEQYI